MSDEIRLEAQTRTEFGKGAARRIRREHKIPAVMYGHGSEPVHITLPGHDTMMALKHSNALLTIVVDGDVPHWPRNGRRRVASATRSCGAKPRIGFCLDASGSAA